MMNVNVYFYKEHKDAKLPDVAYGNTSAAFDVYAAEDVEIKPGESKVVENGIRCSIHENDPYYMVVMDRSSMGFKRALRVYQGVIDAGYTGPLGVLMTNIGTETQVIKKGDKYAQLVVLPKVTPNFVELNSQEFKEFEETQQRGSKGFGSSGK